MIKTNATNARAEFFELINRVNKRHVPAYISYKNGGVVMMSEEDYDSLVETIELLSIPGFRTSIKKGLKQVKRGELFTLKEVFGIDQKI